MMQLFGKKQWILSVIGLTGGLIIASYVLKTKYGEINYWIIGFTGLIGLIIITFISNYANREE